MSLHASTFPLFRNLNSLQIRGKSNVGNGVPQIISLASTPLPYSQSNVQEGCNDFIKQLLGF